MDTSNDLPVMGASWSVSPARELTPEIREKLHDLLNALAYCDFESATIEFLDIQKARRGE